MAKLILDDRKNPIQAFMQKPDGCTITAVTSADPETFEPTIEDRRKVYAIRTTADIRFAVHDADFTFDQATAPPLWAGEEQVFELDGRTRSVVTMQAVSTSADVYITELTDD